MLCDALPANTYIVAVHQPIRIQFNWLVKCGVLFISETRAFCVSVCGGVFVCVCNEWTRMHISFKRDAHVFTINCVCIQKMVLFADDVVTIRTTDVDMCLSVFLIVENSGKIRSVVSLQ